MNLYELLGPDQLDDLRGADRVRHRLRAACEARGFTLISTFRRGAYQLDIIVRDDRDMRYRSIRGDRVIPSPAWTLRALDAHLIVSLIGQLDTLVGRQTAAVT